MTTTHATGSKLAEALTKALADLAVVDKGRKANAGSYSYEYADIGDIINATRPVLAKHGLVALTPVHGYGDDRLACTVLLIHESGEQLELGPLPFPPGRDAQSSGSQITYHRRYALLAALGMATGDDDDGAAATKAQRAPKPSPAKKAVEYSDEQAEAKALIDKLDPDKRKQLTAEWRKQELKRLETMSADDLEAVHELIVKIEGGA